jgi:opacity protein-like surface antigen
MRLSIVVAAVSFVVLARAIGGTEITDDKRIVTTQSPFDQGKVELQSSSGAYFSIGSGNRDTLNYSATAYRIGVMLQTPSGTGLFRGNYELLLQLFGGSVFDGPGNALGGAAIMLRYNFVQPESNWVPYVQIAAGAVYSDIHKDHDQRLIGQAWEIDLEAALGVRYFFNDRWSANLEGGYRHISNADNSDRNVGLNSLGASAGLGLHW